MKKYSFAFLLLIGALTFSCGNKPQEISEMKNASEADSLMYYFGLMQAKNYWLDAMTDTLLKTEEGRREFVKGFRDGLKYDKDDYCYNKGLKEGVRLAIRLRELEKAYGISFPEEMLANSVELAMQSKDSFDVADAQMNFYKIKDRLDLQRGVREGETARKMLAEAATRQNYSMLSDSLYGRDVTPGGAGPKFKEGDQAEIYLTTAKLDGTPIGKQFPPKVKIGKGRVANVICLALLTMTDGQTRSFITTPQAFFGKNYDRYRVNSDEVVQFTIQAQRLPATDSLDNTPPLP